MVRVWKCFFLPFGCSQKCSVVSGEEANHRIAEIRIEYIRQKKNKFGTKEAEKKKERDRGKDKEN